MLSTMVAIACGRQSDSGAATPAATSTWELAARPSLVIGADEQRAGHELHQVVGALRMADGNIAIASYGSADVRVFDQAGSLRWRTGRSGAGPTDFNRITGLRVCGTDTLAVLQQTRISVVTASGQVVRIVSPKVGGSSPQSIGPTTCARSIWLRRAGLQMDKPGLVEQEYRLLRATANHDSVAWTFAGLTRYRTLAEGAPAFVTIPFSPVPAWALWDDRIFWTSGADGAVSFIGADGDRIQRPWTSSRREIGARERTAYEATRLRLLQKDQRYSQSVVPWDEIPLRPTHLPLASQLVADGGTRVWIRPYPASTDGLGLDNVVGIGTAPDTTARETWIVVDEQEGAIATIVLPTAFRITEVRAQEILGVWTDVDGVESVRVYGLLRPRRSRTD